MDVFEVNRPTWKDVTGESAAIDFHRQMMKPPPVVPTGLSSIDRAILTWGRGLGIPRGTYMIVGGGSNVGKTQFGLHLMKQASEHGEKSGLVSLDMKERDARLRIYQALCSDIPPEDWNPTRWTQDHMLRLIEGLKGWQIGVEGEMGLMPATRPELDYLMEYLTTGAEAGGTFFVVDHLQKIRVPGFGGDAIASMAQVVSEALDGFCDEWDVTVVGLSQLNRGASSEVDRTPTIYDLWGGTAMESNASLIVMLDHSRYERVADRPHIGRTYVSLGKNQMGPRVDSVPVEWDHRGLKLREAMPDEMHEWPVHRGRKS